MTLPHICASEALAADVTRRFSDIYRQLLTTLALRSSRVALDLAWLRAIQAAREVTWAAHAAKLGGSSEAPVHRLIGGIGTIDVFLFLGSIGAISAWCGDPELDVHEMRAVRVHQLGAALCDDYPTTFSPDLSSTAYGGWPDFWASTLNAPP
jgi:hypothetical protein